MCARLLVTVDLAGEVKKKQREVTVGSMMSIRVVSLDRKQERERFQRRGNGTGK